MKKSIYTVLSVVLIVLIAVAVVVHTSRDTEPPVISFETDPVYKEGDDKSVLLEGAGAVDDKDGDVSASFMIEQTVVSEDKSSITVYYAAKDSSNNVAKKNRTLTYIPSDTDDSRTYKIMMINNLGIENLATVWSRHLMQEGHVITSMGLSTDPIESQTVICVAKEGDGTELLEFFPNARIEVGTRVGKINTSSNGAEVFIIFGTDDSEIPD